MKAACMLAILAIPAVAQTPSEPPPLLRVIRGDSLGPIGQPPVMVFGMTAITGGPETWLMEAHDSFASIEDTEKLWHTPPQARTLLLVYQPGLSYHPDLAMSNLPKARYFAVSIYQIRPGAEVFFRDLMRMRRAALDSVNVDRPEMVYQAVSGTPASTYVFLAPLSSLRVLDNASPRTPAYAEALTENIATEGRKIAADIELSREPFLLRIDPRLSFVPSDFASADPSFWTPK